MKPEQPHSEKNLVSVLKHAVLKSRDQRAGEFALAEAKFDGWVLEGDGLSLPSLKKSGLSCMVWQDKYDFKRAINKV